MLSQITRHHTMPAVFALAVHPHAAAMHTHAYAAGGQRQLQSCRVVVLAACDTVLHRGSTEGKHKVSTTWVGYSAGGARAYAVRGQAAAPHCNMWLAFQCPAAYGMRCVAVYRHTILCIALTSCVITPKCRAKPCCTVWRVFREMHAHDMVSVNLPEWLRVWA